MSCAAAAGDDVTLRAADGGIELTGELLDFDGEFYRLRTQYGDMTLKALGIVCHGLACPDPGQYAADIAFSGSSGAIAELLPGLVADFGFATGHQTLLSDHGAQGWTYFVSDTANIPVARIQGRPSGAASGFADLAAGRTDIALSRRAPNDAERAAATKAGVGDFSDADHARIVAIDALVFIVSPRNPVSEMSVEDLARVFSGEVTNWADLGGDNATITVFQRNAESDLAALFASALFPPDSERRPKRWRAFSSDRALSDAVMADPFAIGFTGFAGVRNARPVVLKGTCGMRLVPSRFGLMAEDYPLTHHLSVYLPKRRLPVFARNFLAWLGGDQAQIALVRRGFVGQQIEAIPLSAQPERVANAVRAAGDEVSLDALKGFVRVLSGTSRLSLSFRFQDNSRDMDARSVRNVALLARKIEEGVFDGRELIFAGFSDSLGGASGNRRISRQRAEEVITAIRNAAPRADLSRLKMRTLGMGEVAPLACNDDDLGRRINRRVEVWLR